MSTRIPHVLIVEDDPTTRILLRRLFERHLGSTVEEASDGREALAHMEERVPDLVVLDVHLSAMSGVEVLHAMRADERLTGVHCVAVTSESHRQVIAELVAGQVRDILLKPIVLATDVPRLERALTAAMAQAERPTATT